MKLLVGPSYGGSFLFPSDVNLSSLIEAFGKCIVVQSKGYGTDKHFDVQNDAEIDIQLISDDSIALPENKTEQVEAIITLTEEKSKLQTEIYMLKRELENIKKTICTDANHT